MNTSLILLRSSHSLLLTPRNVYPDPYYILVCTMVISIYATKPVPEANCRTRICAAPLMVPRAPNNVLCRVNPQ